MWKKVISNVIKILLGMVLAGALGVFVLLYYSVNQMEEFGYLPFDYIMHCRGYVKEAEGDYIRYRNGDMTYDVSPDYKTVRKLGMEFQCEDDFKESLRILYIKKDFIETLLGENIERNGLLHYSFEEQEYEDLTHLKIPLIAHAGGGYLVKRYTGKYRLVNYQNCSEIIAASYKEGYKAYEIDFILSTDNILCSLHTWDFYDHEMTANEFLKQPARGGGTTLLLSDVLKLFNVNKDMILILDLKSRSWESGELIKWYRKIVEMADRIGGKSLLDRIVPQIYHREEYDMVRQVYDWSCMIFTLYRMSAVADDEIIEYLKDKPDLQIVTIPEERVSSEFCQKLHELGKIVYANTINNINSLYLFLNKGVDGFYTDLMKPDEYYERYGEKQYS